MELNKQEDNFFIIFIALVFIFIANFFTEICLGFLTTLAISYVTGISLAALAFWGVVAMFSFLVLSVVIVAITEK